MEQSLLQEALNLLEERTGLVYEKNHAKWMLRFLKSRLTSLGVHNPGEYLAILRSNEEEWQKFLSAATVKESHFFRHKEQFEWIREEILPRLAVKAKKENRPVRIWSAATARGEEAYTMAMLAIEAGLPGKVDVRIIGSDIDRSSIREARLGEYTLYRLRGLPPGYMERFFVTLGGNKYRVRDEVRKMVNFTEINLAKPPYFDEPIKFDIILARNVFIYMNQKTISAALREIATLMRKSGYLFLGAAESVWPLAEQFQMVRRHGTIAFRPPARRTKSRARHKEVRRKEQGLPMLEYAWALNIPRPDAGLEKPAPKPHALESVLGEDEMAALAQQSLAEGKLKEAEAWASMALRKNTLSAKAYFILGVVYSREGMIEEGIDAFRKALYLEPTMAGAYFELGNLYLRRGDVKWARVAFRNAVRFADQATDTMLPGFPPKLLKWAAERALKRLRLPT